LTSVEGEVRGQYLATAANAVDHTVERRVLLVDWIVRIHQVFLRGHLIGARLAVADRCGIRR
jgi:small-conductance mechanosensitive channel